MMDSVDEKVKRNPGVEVYAFNPSTQKAETGRSLGILGQPGLQSEFQTCQGYTEKGCLKN